MRTLSDESLSRLTPEIVVAYLEKHGWVKSEHPANIYPVCYVRPEDSKNRVGFFPPMKTNYFEGGMRRLLGNLEHFENRDAHEIVREMLGLPAAEAEAWAEAARLLEEAEPTLHNTHDVTELVKEFRRRAGVKD